MSGQYLKTKSNYLIWQQKEKYEIEICFALFFAFGFMFFFSSFWI